MIVLIIILCIIIATISFWLGRRRSNVAQIEKNKIVEKYNNELEEEVAHKKSILQDIAIKAIEEEENFRNATLEAQQQYNELVNKLLIDFKNTEADYALRAAEMSHNLDLVKDNRFSKINEAATLYREKLYTDIKEENEKIILLYENERQSRFNELEQLNNDISELRETRDALIEANKREEEMRMQQDFYKIQLSSQDFNDINLLKSIEQHLFNKDPLYKLIWSQFYMTPTKAMLNRIIGKDKTSGVYKITNQINGKVYIGQSVDLHSRLTNHIKASIGIGTIAHQLIHDAMAENGIENFTFEIIEKCEKEQLNKKEKLWIETYASDKYGYNRTAGGAKEE